MPFQAHSEPAQLWFSRLSFPQLFVPKQVVIQGRVVKDAKRYSCLIILTDKVAQDVWEIEERLIRESWPEWGGTQPPAGVILDRAMKKGEIIRPGDPHLAGKWVISANADETRPPAVVEFNAQTGEYLPLQDRSRIYSGCEAHVHVGLYTRQLKECQINAGLNKVWPTDRKWPSFGGGVSNEEAFGGGPGADAYVPPAPEGVSPEGPGPGPAGPGPAGPGPAGPGPGPGPAGPAGPAGPGPGPAGPGPAIFNPEDPSTW